MKCDNENALLPVGPSLVLLVFWFSLFCLLPLHIQSQTERAGDILKTGVCFVTYFCVYIVLRLCKNKAAVWMNRCTVQPSALAGI